MPLLVEVTSSPAAVRGTVLSPPLPPCPPETLNLSGSPSPPTAQLPCPFLQPPPRLIKPPHEGLDSPSYSYSKRKESQPHLVQAKL